jgi:hypothetical protein
MDRGAEGQGGKRAVGIDGQRVEDVENNELGQRNVMGSESAEARRVRRLYLHSSAVYWG